jgi:hypothetical protein
MKQLQREQIRVDQVECFAKVDEEQHGDRFLISDRVDVGDELVQRCFAAVARSEPVLTTVEDVVLICVDNYLFGYYFLE